MDTPVNITLLIQKEIHLISGFLKKDESYNKEVFTGYDFDSSLGDNNKLADQINNSQGNSYILPTATEHIKTNINIRKAIFYAFKDGKLYDMSNDIRVLKAKKKQAVQDYYKSEALKKVFINKKPCWIKSETRGSLLMRLGAETEAKTEALASVGIFTVDRMNAIGAVKQIELYAAKCWDVTNVVHKVNIDRLTKAVDVSDYDIKDKYPKPLNITL